MSRPPIKATLPYSDEYIVNTQGKLIACALFLCGLAASFIVENDIQSSSCVFMRLIDSRSDVYCARKLHDLFPASKYKPKTDDQLRQKVTLDVHDPVAVAASKVEYYDAYYADTGDATDYGKEIETKEDDYEVEERKLNEDLAISTHPSQYHAGDLIHAESYNISQSTSIDTSSLAAPDTTGSIADDALAPSLNKELATRFGGF